MIDADKFFNVNYINEVPIQNGVLNIKTRELSDFNPNGGIELFEACLNQLKLAVKSGNRF